MDYSKLTSKDIELKASHNRLDEQRVKRAGFEHRMDRVNTSLKNVKSESEFKRLKNIQNSTYKLYKKYA